MSVSPQVCVTALHGCKDRDLNLAAGLRNEVNAFIEG